MEITRSQNMQNKNKDNQIHVALSTKSRYDLFTLLQTSKKACDIYELAKQVGLHPNVVRYHIGHLEKIGMVESSTTKEKKVGKPKKLYSFSGKHIEGEVPQRQFQLLSDLLCKLCLDILPEQDLERRALEIGRKIGKEWMTEEMEKKNKKSFNMKECANSILRIFS
jgi:predicted ArsR family transcriptional regulator